MMNEANIENLDTIPPPPPPANFSYEELHRKTRDIFPLPFDGAKVLLNRGLSQHFQVLFFIIF